MLVDLLVVYTTAVHSDRVKILLTVCLVAGYADSAAS